MKVIYQKGKVLLGVFMMISSFSIHATNLKLKPISSEQQTQLKNYYESGQYFNEIERKLIDAKEYLDRQLQEERQTRIALVLDVDETALSNFRHLERLHFTQNSIALTGAIMLANAEPILPVLNLYQYAISKDVAVFFISSRPNTPEFMITTANNLKSAGFLQWEELILKPLQDDDISTEEFKTNTRKRITTLGYDIVLNIGDQEADLQGGYAQVRLKLPNPFYEIS
ncbi:MAG: acid phosphatase [Gammaproteobacteria bacterium]|nr:acid phosphatase [Gammaproteobacteria bacterium]